MPPFINNVTRSTIRTMHADMAGTNEIRRQTNHSWLCIPQGLGESLDRLQNIARSTPAIEFIIFGMKRWLMSARIAWSRKVEDLDRGTRDGPQPLILMSPSSRSMKVVTVYTAPLEG